MKLKTKDDVIIAIHSCAALYNKNLVHKNVLFVTLQNGLVHSFETLFRPSNFLHLTGVSSRLDGDRFYQAAIGNRLGANDITIAPDGKTDLKLEVLPQLMDIHVKARMVGDFNNSMPLLVTDKLAGTSTMAMGFIDINGVYIPNTALKKDLRDITNHATRRKIVAIFVKPREEPLYERLTYIARDVAIDDAILKPITHEKVDIQNLTAAFPIPRTHCLRNEKSRPSSGKDSGSNATLN
jgi:hypothetical protein